MCSVVTGFGQYISQCNFSVVYPENPLGFSFLKSPPQPTLEFRKITFMPFKNRSPFVPCQVLQCDLFHCGFSLSFVKSQKGTLIGGSPWRIVLYMGQRHMNSFWHFIQALGLADLFQFSNIACMGLLLWTCNALLDIKVSRYTDISIILGLYKIMANLFLSLHPVLLLDSSTYLSTLCKTHSSVFQSLQ